MMMAIDSQIRCRTCRFLNQLQSHMDLSQSFNIPEQFSIDLLNLVQNESLLPVLDELLPLASQFQRKNARFIDGEFHR
jgi:hypothetical protein